MFISAIEINILFFENKTIKLGGLRKYPYICDNISQSGAAVARRAHNPKVAGSSPVSATKQISQKSSN